MKLYIYLTLILVLVIGSTTHRVAQASSTSQASAEARVKVITSISIAKEKDLEFGEAAPEDPAKSIETSATGAASFTVKGQADHSYSIVITSSVDMVKDGGNASNADHKIRVDSFKSDPSGAGKITAGGAQTVKVGATRAALSPTQATGDYKGSFDVTVTYQ